MIRNGISEYNVIQIIGVKPNEGIKYLGCTFNSQLVFDNTCIETLNIFVTKARSKTQHHKPINSKYWYIPYSSTSPRDSFVYNQWSGCYVIRRTVKEIIGLPLRTNGYLFYSPPRKLRGFGLFRASQEVHHFSIATKLSKIDDGSFQRISQCSAEIEFCIQTLNVVVDATKMLLAALRNDSFEKWCSLNYPGSGAIHFIYSLFTMSPIMISFTTKIRYLRLNGYRL